MKSIVVFCGSKAGKKPIFREVATEVGKIFTENDITLVYGGGGIGLMGVIANTVLNGNGSVIGVIPHFLQHVEGTERELTEFYLVNSMQERKDKMASLSNAVLVLPGAYGTLDELFEMVTLNQLSQGNWPVGILNVDGYYDHLIAHFDHMRDMGFLTQQNRDMIMVSEDPEHLIQQLLK